MKAFDDILKRVSCDTLTVTSTPLIEYWYEYTTGSKLIYEYNTNEFKFIEDLRYQFDGDIGGVSALEDMFDECAPGLEDKCDQAVEFANQGMSIKITFPYKQSKVGIGVEFRNAKKADFTGVNKEFFIAQAREVLDVLRDHSTNRRKPRLASMVVEFEDGALVNIKQYRPQIFELTTKLSATTKVVEIDSAIYDEDWTWRWREALAKLGVTDSKAIVSKKLKFSFNGETYTITYNKQDKYCVLESPTRELAICEYADVEASDALHDKIASLGGLSAEAVSFAWFMFTSFPSAE